ncbi:multicopper oxidase family protein [Streptomyces alkaliterrae]|uniref:Multicopper oxidase domain-containing protein n=1 Tax=Streptomyces alkaliterrae TaxID=2213162 RepID=A0A5P0YVY3_9ACTN|nr:multicopper oxidase family protein [Streptomyces alkaliterrae]MBB1259056.1 multicopper oxidase family protein [Streptomyces alkaliterrae]MQS04456.1 multicopper oxidase domain-containing protein [Streptomyces alkaliterrae]
MRTSTRRAVLGTGLAVAGGGLLAACSSSGTDHSGHAAKPPAGPEGYVSPDGREVAAAEAKRRPGPVRKVKLTATPARLDLGGRTVRTWAYDDEVPGKEVRVTAGDTLALTLANNLPQSTSIHWHGLALRNDMDGTPGLTQQPIRAGASFEYRFAVAHPGTHWFHPHSGVQLDRGLYAPLIIEDPREPLKYDKEWVVVLDDWLDGVDGSTPDMVLAEFRKGMGDMDHGDMDHGGHSMPRMSMTTGNSPSPEPSGPSRMMMGATSELLGGDAGDVAYPYYLVNGRTADDPQTFRAKPGDRVRIRFVNAGGDTAFRVALGGHRMTVTHTDGFPVEHAETDALLLGMGERYDVLVTAGDGAFPLTALAEGKKRSAMAVLRTGGGAAPKPSVRPKELDGRLLQARQLKSDGSVRLKPGKPDRTVKLSLTGSMAKYDWSVNGKKYDPAQRYPVRSGERVRLSFVNNTTMWHPMHLHGHTFALGEGGPRKDTAIVLPRQTVDVDFDADNPGLWMVHCHNVYHAESGMMTTLGYLK